jgi:GxxExxY protein
MNPIDCHTSEMKERANQLSKEVIGAAIEVHRHLGPGLLESAYEACLEHELKARGYRIERQLPLPILYKGLLVDAAYRIDLLVDDLLVLELKAVEALDGIHEAQLITYLRLSMRWLGLLMNFNTVVLTKGIKRFVNG